MARRIRRHANPFHVRTELGHIDRMALFGREAPLEVDLGCGGASFLFERARNHPECDFVGLEVRRPLVEVAAERRARDGIPNAIVLYASASDNIRLAEPGIVRCFHIHFPDPCFKKRHWKRRIVQPTIVRAMCEALPIGGQVYLQSDVEPLALEMYAFLASESAFASRLDAHMIVARPFPETTEWERQHEREGEPIYRMLFEKVREPVGEVAPAVFHDTRPR